MLNIPLSLLIIAILISILWRFFSQRYSLPCPTWLAWMVEMDNPFSKINRAATIVQNADIKPGMKALDVGCGPGRVTIPLAHAVGKTGHVVAMDIQQGMLDKTRKKAEAANLKNITYLHASIGDNKLEQNRFDRILLVTVLGEIPHQQAALQEIFNALKPGGILSVTEIIFDPHYQRRSKILDLANTVGFKEKQFFGNWVAFTLNLEKPI